MWAAGIIVSRKATSDYWLRSNYQLVLNGEGFGSDLYSLAKAVEYSYKASQIDMESEHYLNNTDNSGCQTAE